MTQNKHFHSVWKVCKSEEHLQGRILGYLFFSLFSSLLASSKVLQPKPQGKDFKREAAEERNIMWV